MSELAAERWFEVATDGSDRTERLCAELLEPLADSITGCKFNESDTDSVCREQQLKFNDGAVIAIEFGASYYQETDSDRGDGALYSISVTFRREVEEGEYWPNPAEQSEEDQDEESAETSSLLLADEDEEDEAVQEWPEMKVVQEVWHFLVDNVQYRPRKDVRFEYYYDGVPFDVLHVTEEQVQVKLLSDNMTEDMDLSVNDACFAQVFSEQDIKIIEAACKFDFNRLLSLLCQREQWSI